MPTSDRLQSLLRIRPQPASTIYTTALLSKLKAQLHFQDFSRAHPHQYDKACSLFNLHFESEHDMHKAMLRSPLFVDLAFGKQQQDIPPSSSYGLNLEQPRYVPPTQSFRCTLESPSNSDPGREPRRDRPLVEDGGSQALRDALAATGAPLNLVPGLAKHPVGSRMKLPATKVQQRQDDHTT
jgi:hypothetical protein